MAALFSCTKCHKRYPFEELSKGEQLCKDCRNNFPTDKCIYCREEFQQNSKGSTSSICGKCVQNVKHYGKPTACENCSILAAFIGKRCQRCVNSEKKWGPPLICDQCKLKCAFERPERRKINGKLMCWLCDQAYKRVLAKTQKTLRPSGVSSSDSVSRLNESPNTRQSCATSHHIPSSTSFEGMTVLERLTKLATSGGSSRDNTPPLETVRPAKIETDSRLVDKSQSCVDDIINTDDVGEEKLHKQHHWKQQQQNNSELKKHHSKEDDAGSGGKKAKLEKNTTNGALVATSTPRSTGSNVSETGLDSLTSESVIMITQLREQIESLKKQLAVKDQLLLDKDKKITELKAQMYECDKEFRTKIQAMQRSHTTAIENLQVKNRDLTHHVTSLLKNKRSTSTVSITTS